MHGIQRSRRAGAHVAHTRGGAEALAELGRCTFTRAAPADLIVEAVRAVSSALGVQIVAVDERLADGDPIVRAVVGLGIRPIGVVRGSAGQGSQAGLHALAGETRAQRLPGL